MGDYMLMSSLCPRLLCVLSKMLEVAFSVLLLGCVFVGSWHGGGRDDGSFDLLLWRFDCVFFRFELVAFDVWHGDDGSVMLTRQKKENI